jgi:succinyl-diaminopimelate desuccinylase
VREGGKFMDLKSRIDMMRDDLIKSTQEILKIKSVQDEAKTGMPFGEGVGKSLECALKISEELGFKTVNMDGYIGYAEYGEGEDYIGVLGHLDVVPEGDGWTYPPYGAEIHDGKLYARGAADDKGPIIAALYGLKAVKDEGLPLTKRVRIIFGTNEETGCKEMCYYNEREKPPVAGFTPDAEFPIIYGEKGLTIFDVVKDLNVKQSEGNVIKYIKGGLRANMVPEYCEAGVTSKDGKSLVNEVEAFAGESGFALKAEIKSDMVIIKSFGASAHGSLPQNGKNAIMQMFALLGKINLGESDITNYIDFFNKYVGMDVYGEVFGVGLEDEPSGKLSFNVGTIEMNEDRVKMTLNLRYPVTFKEEDLMIPFNSRLDGTGIRVENFDNINPLFYPEDHPLIKTLQRVYTEETGQEATLMAIGGGTYAKTMDNIVAFGPLLPGKPDTIHKPDEYIEVEDLVLCAKIYGKAIYELAK